MLDRVDVRAKGRVRPVATCRELSEEGCGNSVSPRLMGSVSTNDAEG
jgi:hypothetical protein